MNEYFEMVKPTYIENWPKELCSLSIAQSGIKLSLEEACSLGTNISELGFFFDDVLITASDNYCHDISSIKEKIVKEIINFPKGVFVRLGSRSPKDSWYGHRNGFKCSNADQVMSLLTDASERICDDLLLAIDNNYEPWIWIRKWMKIPEWAEFRCFMKNRQLVGISQYNYLSNKIYPEISKYERSIIFAIKRFFEDFKTKSHLNDVIFDVYLKIKQRGNEIESEVKLIEINPFCKDTDPCLFDWRFEDGWDRSFRYNKQGGEKWMTLST